MRMRPVTTKYPAIAAVIGFAVVAMLASFLLWAAQAQRKAEFVTPPAKAVKEVFPGNARRIWERSRTLTLYSLEPRPALADLVAPKPTLRSVIGDHEILNKVVVSNPAQLKRLRAAVDDVYAPRGDFAARAACFSPRHAVRAQVGKETVDFIVCFECNGGYVHRNKATESVSSFTVSSERAAPLFDTLLQADRAPPDAR